MNKKLLSKSLIVLATGLLSIMCCTTNLMAETYRSVENRADFSSDVIYQIITDRFADGDETNNPKGEIFDKADLRKYHGGDWRGIINKIEDGYLTNLGITAIWISSPVENITTIDPTNQSAAYHGYWARDFFKTNAAFGTEEDFKELVSTAHKHGIKIVIDFAPNHTSTAEYNGLVFPEDGALYKKGELLGKFSSDTAKIFNHEGWTNYSTYENGIYHSLYGLADLNNLNPTVDQYMKEAIETWIDLGIDGIRVDVVKHMSLGWQKNWLSYIYEKKGLFVFGEWYTGGTEAEPEMTHFANESGMSLLDFRFANSIRSLFTNSNYTMTDFYNVIKATEKDYEEVNDQVTFIDNHDMSRFSSIVNGNQVAVNQAYALLLTSRGVPTIYYGTEQYDKGDSDPHNRGDISSFDTSSDAYKIISKLSVLRKQNKALAYGSTEERWINSDVLVFERKFGEHVALIAVNKGSNNYQIENLKTSLPQGQYNDELSSLLSGNSIQVGVEGQVSSFSLAPNAVGVWVYNNQSNKLLLGDVDPSMGKTGNELTLTGEGFGDRQGKVHFGNHEAQVTTWSDTLIRVTIPSITSGKYDIKVSNTSGEEDVYKNFEVLSGSQIPFRMIVDNAMTIPGENLYIVGNVAELGNWDTNKAIGPLFNATASIAQYPSWFYDLSLPINKNIEYKFIKKNQYGQIVWEGGENHLLETGNEAMIVRTQWQN
ncbi:alpha-amylase family glycosyl hydrolase [Streptococcus ruminantium]|uniref:Alpha-amylase family glycosyl hydrolase n=1 Tax=Streptococcus ruminantium TaxID=1917441 RepID=A0ABU1B1B5_9STRE|nr:alpha-amylase family glycosyl hydrolase [Streptococcus ruminantium]MDQ8759507.1 alpha-amylase family glycosyl hydrolase [Streptococcus ruminantium]MDQ8764363.1 alpha-amylase family glycosyl hydrolase [Streptococcus ruminantium]MDQ8768485.1 alpha-amylase family glycosyl hydrolase [Streptococcus ruminantium]MDQ8774358.1 alpha-amylase family glycosyl hydrolase [Streptococcus ruminantium]MDQ8793268.1 alpha-amylase family glycosyl hydrolase [Streptococcus ruminantium]